VYYLRKGTASEKSAKYAGILDRYLDALCRMDDHRKATAEVMTPEILHSINADFAAFWKSKNKRSAAARFDIAARLPQAPAATSSR